MPVSHLPSDVPTPAFVLVVDDESAVCQLIADVLMDAGYLTATAADARSAMVCAARRRPDLVVVDLNLPGIGGEALAATLDLVFGGKVPLLLISGEVGAVERARGLRPTTFLPKPFDLDVFL